MEFGVHFPPQESSGMWVFSSFSVTVTHCQRMLEVMGPLVAVRFDQNVIHKGVLVVRDPGSVSSCP